MTTPFSLTLKEIWCSGSRDLKVQRIIQGYYSPCHFEVRRSHREISFQHGEISRFARNDTVAE